MKPIVQKILDAGLVSKHTARLMERWGLMDIGSGPSIADATSQSLEAFAGDIADLLAKEEEVAVKETRLDSPLHVKKVVLTFGTVGGRSDPAYQDDMGNFFVSFTGYSYVPGQEFSVIADDSSRQDYVIDSVDDIYENNTVKGHQLNVHKKAGGQYAVV